MRGNLLRTTAFIVGGGILFNATSAYADLPTIDVITHFLLQQGTNFVTRSIDNLQNKLLDVGNMLADKVTNVGDNLSDLLTRGFTQQSNYQKAAVGAQMQIADGQNAAMARVNRDTRNAQIVSEHTVSPQQCVAASNGQGNVAASVAAVQVAQTIGAITDNRGRGASPASPPTTDRRRRCKPSTACTCPAIAQRPRTTPDSAPRPPSPTPTSTDGTCSANGNYGDQDGVNAANDYATNLLQPIVPAALRADQLTSVTGQDASARRRSYNARMSLGRNLLNYVIGIQAPVVPLTATQKQQLINEGLPATNQGSWLQALTLEVDRRFSDLGWAVALQAMPPATVQREIATELALSNYLALQNYRVALWQAALTATQVAQIEEVNFRSIAALISTPTLNYSAAC